MAMLTIRNLDETLKTELRIRAAKHGWSMEEEARRILRAALSTQEPGRIGLGSKIHRRVLDLTGGVELSPPTRSSPRPAPDFGVKIGPGGNP